MTRLARRSPWPALAAFTALLLLASWERWGNPVSDPGLDLTVAAGWLDGELPYRDVRYWYGPLGIAGLAGSFALLGTSLWAAWAFGLVQTAVIAELWRRLARRWLPPGVAIAGVAVVLAIGFSGSLFNLQLAHTAAASTGVIALLAVLLAISHERWLLAGLATGAAALTRPEFLAFAAVALVAAALGVWREAGLRAAAGLFARGAAGALLVAVPVLGYFAAQAGAHALFFEQLFPVDFVRVAGDTFERHWHPFDLPSAGSLLLRGTALAAAAWGLLRVLEAWLDARRAGLPRGRIVRLAAGPAAVAIGLVLAAGVAGTLLAAVGGDAGAPVRELADDAARLLLPMTGLPLIAFAAGLTALLAWWRREPSPLGEPPAAPGTPAALALLGVAAACALRAYAEFSTDVYATYYAPPVVLVAAILLYRSARSLPPAWRSGATGAVLAAAAIVLALHAWGGRYTDQTYRVHSPQGSYLADAAAGPAVDGVVRLLAPRVRPGEPMLVLPQEPGFHFLLGTRPALHEATFLPGTLHDAAADAAAARELERVAPRYVIVAARRFEAWGFRASGDDFNRRLHAAVRAGWCELARFGDTARPPASELPAQAFTVYQRCG